jgi:TatD DNase family protein
MASGTADSETWAYLVDTHAHLDDVKFGADRDDVVRRALQAGVAQIITVGADLPSTRSAIALSERHPSVFATVGIHPHDAQKASPSALSKVRDLASHPRVVAVGEIGLDFYRDWCPRDAQRAAFEAQLGLAAEVGKPVVVHIRDKGGETGAYDEALKTLRAWLSGRREGDPVIRSPGVLHCFSGDVRTAESILELGFYIGVDGPVTYPAAKALQSVIAQVPLERLLLETDCPYMAPQSLRGRRNEPAFLPEIALKVAQIKATAPQEVARVTTSSACRVFGLPGR